MVLAGSTPDLPAPRVATELEPRREFPFASPAVFLRWPPSFQLVPRGNLIGEIGVCGLRATGRPTPVALCPPRRRLPCSQAQQCYRGGHSLLNGSHFWPTGTPANEGYPALPGVVYPRRPTRKVKTSVAIHGTGATTRGVAP